MEVTSITDILVSYLILYFRPRYENVYPGLYYVVIIEQETTEQTIM